MTRPDAVIFDMDETLVNTRALWQQAERALFVSLGGTWTEEKAAAYKGRNVADVATIIHGLCGAAGDAGGTREVFRRLLFEAFTHGPIEEMPGAVACVRSLAQSFPLAVASGSPLPLIELALNTLDVRPLFEVLVSSESVARGKPHPDVFLAAAAALGVRAEGCLVIEDSLAGAQAARAAGMPCFVVPSVEGPELASVATRVFRGLDEIGAGMEGNALDTSL